MKKSSRLILLYWFKYIQEKLLIKLLIFFYWAKLNKPIIPPYGGNEKNFCDVLIYLYQDTKEYEDAIKLFQERYNNKIIKEIPKYNSIYLSWVKILKEKVNSELNKRAEKYELVEPNSGYIDIFSEDPKVIVEKLKPIKYVEKYIEIGRQIERNENQLKKEQSTTIEKLKGNQQTKGCNIF